jgi:hypothetical protein
VIGNPEFALPCLVACPALLPVGGTHLDSPVKPFRAHADTIDVRIRTSQRRPLLRIGVALASLSLSAWASGCAASSTSGNNSSPHVSHKTLALGQNAFVPKTDSLLGGRINTVSVLKIADPEPGSPALASAELRVCTAGKGGPTLFMWKSFDAELSSGVGRFPLASTTLRPPSSALENQRPDTCALGWVSYRVASSSERLVAVQFSTGSTVVEWKA